MWLIYKHTNKINNKSYIGQTSSKKKKKRWRQGKGYSKNSLFTAAIAKYGWDNFEHEILVNNIENQEQANELEIFYIQKYHTWIQDPNCWGYNILPGGTINNKQLLGRPIYQIDINKNILCEYISAADAAAQLFPDNTTYAEMEIAKCCKNLRSNALGLYFCYKKDYKNYNFIIQKNSKNVILQLDKNKTILGRYRSLQDAENNTNTSSVHIKQCCDGIRKTSNNYYWCYEVNYNSFIPQQPRIKIGPKKVAQIDLNAHKIITIFNSATEASNQTNISRGNICSCCRKQLKSAGQFGWEYV